MASEVHPLLGCTAVVESAVKDVADANPVFMSVTDKKAALLGLSQVIGQLEELRLRVLATADDVAAADGARDAAAWLGHHARLDRAETRRRLRLAEGLDRRWSVAAQALREGSANLEQVQVIASALDALPDELDADVHRRAEAHLVAEAVTYGPRALKVLGRKVLEVVAPEVGEDHERRKLEREEATASRRTSLTSRRNGDGTTDLRIRVADVIADRLQTYLEAFTSPRHADAEDRRPYDRRLGAAFGAFLEAFDPARLPLHGGDATTVFVTIDLATLRDQLGTAVVGDTPISAGQARRLACTAKLVPLVLGGASEVLDLGRGRRLFSPAQRKALAIRDTSCRADGCDIPAAWCEAHHAGAPWVDGGRTDLADGVLLCSFHHHRAHDRRYDSRRLPDGTIRFHRRT